MIKNCGWIFVIFAVVALFIYGFYLIDKKEDENIKIKILAQEKSDKNFEKDLNDGYGTRIISVSGMLSAQYATVEFNKFAAMANRSGWIGVGEPKIIEKSMSWGMEQKFVKEKQLSGGKQNG
jgi:hypothetical protein